MPCRPIRLPAVTLSRGSFGCPTTPSLSRSRRPRRCRVRLDVRPTRDQSTEDVASLDPPAPRATILDRFRAAWTGIDGPILLDVLALLAFPILRTLGDNTLMGAWAVAVLILAIRWPGSGLGLAAALMVFPQPTRIGLAPSVALIAASSIGFAVDLALSGQPAGAMRRRLAVVVGGVVALAAADLGGPRALRFSGSTRKSLFWPHAGGSSWRGPRVLPHVALGVLDRLLKRPLLLGLIGIGAALAVSLVDFFAPGFLPSIGVPVADPGTGVVATGPFCRPKHSWDRGRHPGDRRRVSDIDDQPVAVALGRADGAVCGRPVASFSRGALLALVVAGAAVLAIRCAMCRRRRSGRACARGRGRGPDLPRRATGRLRRDASGRADKRSGTDRRLAGGIPDDRG